MKTKLLFSVLFFLTINTCLGQTQLEMNESANKEYQKTDNELNFVYQAILKNYKSDTVFIKNLKNAQRIWIQFRDAEMQAKYPGREYGYYGSIHPMCWSIYLRELTQERIKKLRVWLTGVPEGDSCTSSVKIIN